MKTAANIRQVWASNLDEEILNLSSLIDRYEYIAIDTEFPGVVLRMVANHGPDANYQILRHNVDLLKIIQLGLTLSDASGQSPPQISTWQFNFSFSLTNDVYAQDSIDLLTTSGIDFAAHERDGIDVLIFGELLVSSGLVINPGIKWLSFHGTYDFAYLYKVLMAEPLPDSEAAFLHVVSLFFPTLYDVKTLVQKSDTLYGGLNKIADTLGCQRVGTTHQAGSDSLLTLDVYWRLLHQVFHGQIDDSKRGVIFGLGPYAKSPSALFSSNNVDPSTGNGVVEPAPPPPSPPPATMAPS